MFILRKNMSRKTFHKIIIVILLALFLCYFSSVTLFYHCHTVDGVTIVHSHFYKDCDNPDNSNTTGHKHSSSQINLISHLSVINIIISFLCFSFNIYLLKTYKKSIIKDIKEKTNYYFLNLSLRAPPSIFTT